MFSYGDSRRTLSETLFSKSARWHGIVEQSGEEVKQRTIIKHMQVAIKARHSANWQAFNVAGSTWRIAVGVAPYVPRSVHKKDA